MRYRRTFTLICLIFVGIRYSVSAQYNNTEFPRFDVIHTEYSTNGNYFFAISPYLVIIDNFGIPVFYRKISGGVRNFKPQPGGELTYYDNSRKKFFSLGSFYHVVDSFFMADNYEVDFHEFKLLENGNCLMIGRDLQSVDMSVLIPGGKPNATLAGLIIRELDQD